MATITILCVSLLVILYAMLSLNVSLSRLRKRKATISEAQLTKAIRAHGNASEYIPIFAALLLYLNMVAPSSYVGTISVIVLVSRVLHAGGMYAAPTVDTRHPLKFIGAIGTYISLFTLGEALLQQWFRVKG
jgi:uncharacterized membrane protein YecN with MAPEG domain